MARRRKLAIGKAPESAPKPRKESSAQPSAERRSERERAAQTAAPVLPVHVAAVEVADGWGWEPTDFTGLGRFPAALLPVVPRALTVECLHVPTGWRWLLTSSRKAFERAQGLGVACFAWGEWGPLAACAEQGGLMLGDLLRARVAGSRALNRRTLGVRSDVAVTWEIERVMREMQSEVVRVEVKPC